MAFGFTALVSAAASGSSGAALNLSITLAAHDNVKALITYGSATTITETVSDGTNTYTKLQSVNIAGDSQTYSLYECKDAVAGSYTLAFTPGSAQAFRGIAVGNWTSLDNAIAGLHNGQTQGSPGTGANALTSLTVTPATQPGAAIGFGIDDAGSATTLTAGTGYTSRGTIANWDSGLSVISRVEDIPISSLSAKAATFTATSAPGHTVAFVVYSPESGGGGGSTGTLAKTNANDVGAISGTTTILGTAAKSNANDSSAAAGKTTILGTVSKINANDTSAAAGATTVIGSLAKTNANDTSAASGASTISGSLAQSNANDALAAAGSVGAVVSGTSTTTNANDTSAAAGTPSIVGSLAKVNANDASAASGTTTLNGSATPSNANDTITAAGSSVIVGALANTNANDVATASGSAGAATGTVTYTNLPDTVSASGIVPIPASSAANPPGQIGDPRPRREHWPKQGIGYEEEFRLLQEAEQAEQAEAARAAKAVADAAKALRNAKKAARVSTDADTLEAVAAREAAYARALEDQEIQRAIAELLQEDEDAMNLIMSVL